MESPYRGRVVDLVNPYSNRDTNRGGGLRSKGPDRALQWLDEHPGRWAMVGEGEMGTTIGTLGQRGYAHSVRGDRTYASRPHPEGESLRDALNRTAVVFDALPRLERDPFNWTPAELADAVQTARDNLFPAGPIREEGP